MVDGDSFEAPHDQKQVRNLAQAVRTADAGPGTGIKNFDDDMQTVINGVHDTTLYSLWFYLKSESL